MRALWMLEVERYTCEYGRQQEYL